jgi:hypothetical protein
MQNISEIPHLRVYRQKALLPTDRKIQTMYGMVFINNNSTEAAIDLINSNHLSANNKYHIYYMENIYTGRLFNRTYRDVITQSRDAIYDKVEKAARNIKSERTLTSVAKRNMYFDMQHYNEIFFKNAQRVTVYRQKVETYLEHMKDLFNDQRFAAYREKVMIINVNDWMDNIKSKFSRDTKMDNPIMYLYYAMTKTPEKLKELGDMDIIFYSGNTMVRVNPSKCDKYSYRLFRMELSKLSQNPLFNDEKEMESNFDKQEMINHVVKNFSDHYNFTGEDGEADDEVEGEVKKRAEEIAEELDDKSEGDSGVTGKKLEDEISKKLINDEKLLRDVYSINKERVTGKSGTSNKRDQELREKQKQLKLDNMSLEDIKNFDARKTKIEKNNVTDKVATTNKNLTTVTFPHFEKSYNEQLYKKDLVDAITSLSGENRSIPAFIRKIESEDTSDEMNFKETYTVELEDANRVRHRLKFDMPKFIDDKFMYLNGNKKIIDKQLTLKPIVKIGPNEVKIATSYNRAFISRHGQKVSAKIEKFKKAVIGNPKGITVKYGNNVAANTNYKTTIEYDEISKDFTYLRFGNSEFYFNQDEVTKICKDRNIKIQDNQLCVGFIDKKDPVTVDLDTQKIGKEFDLIDYILSLESGKLITDAFNSATTGKKFIYTRTKIMNKEIPIVLLLGYCEGLSTVLRKASIQHYFTDTRPRLDISQGSIQFADGYLVYDKYPFENSLLMNAFGDIPTKAFNYEDLDDKDAYLTIFDAMFKDRKLANALTNFYECMIDPVTKEVLEDLNYPTTFVELFLFANSLLSDNSFTPENDMSQYRVRSNEVINGLLYKAIADAYGMYRISANNNNPKKISIPQDLILKRVLSLNTIEDYSILNPIVELEKSRAITPKGFGGMNLSDAYTQDKRAYDKTMMGVLAMSTSPDANCGIVRQLTTEPNILSPRGYIDVKNEKLNELNDANLFSPAELLSPMGVSRDDSIRTAMATKQSKHIIPIKKSSPVLISNGAEQVIHYHLSDDFSVVAKHDGKVVEVNEEAGLIIVEYTDKNGIPQPDGGMKNTLKQAIDISERVVKNGAGGFYLSNQLQSNLKVGQNFKKNDILASDKKFFSETELDGNRFNIGSLQKVAVMGSYSTYEDSTFITDKLSRDMASDIVMQKPITLGKNANLDYIVKVGDKVKVGDELLRFEMSFEDDSLNKFLSSVGDELQEEIRTMGKTPIKSKYSGEIVDVKVYSTVELDELSPSLRKLVQGYYTRINKKKKVLNAHDNTKSAHKLGILVNEPTEKIETKDGKVKGHEVGEGVLIEIFIKYHDIMGVGDKLTFFTALKSIIGEVVPVGYEPFALSRPDEEISSVIAPGAILARMTPSILLTMFGNKVLVEMKRQLQEIYTGKPWEAPKE